MTQTDTPALLREYAATLRNLAAENEAMEQRMLHVTNEMQRELIRDANNHLSVYIDQYINESRILRHIIEDYSNELEKKAHAYEATCLPFFPISPADIQLWWKEAYPVIEQIATVAGAITGVAAIAVTPISFIKWVRNKLQRKREKSELTWIKTILEKDEWNISMLSQKLDITDDEAKKILKGFGYEWDAKKMLYVATDNTQKLRNIKPFG